MLHRLVTVLDALDYEVPIPLWDDASKTPQPHDGYLPETGALTASEGGLRCRRGRPHGADCRRRARARTARKGAHLIALGDSLRALKRVGLDAEARRLGFEALYAHWPSRGKA